MKAAARMSVWGISLLTAAAVGCSNPAMTSRPGAAPPRALDLLTPATIGLKYGATAELRVRYRTDDTARLPLGGANVRFSIFGDPAGSTLSLDRAVTDGDGYASVTLTAGQAEASFRIAATAADAPEADFNVTVSKFDLVQLNVQLAYANSVTLRALLYDNHVCSDLGPTASMPPSFRIQSAPGPSTTLSFVALLSRNYALAGRAEDANGHLMAYGCADLPAPLVPAGSQSTLPLPLNRTRVSPLGTYALSSMLYAAPSLGATLLGSWQTFGDCMYGVAQTLLDAMEPSLSQPLVAAIEANRTALAGTCRPAASALDQQLQAALSMSNSALGSLPGIVDDLENIVGKPALTSTLTVAAAGPNGYVAAHALGTLTLSSGTFSNDYSLTQAGVPIIVAKEIAVSYDGTTLMLGSHGFTARLPMFWRQAFLTLSLPHRLPMVASIADLVGGLVNGAAHNGKSGCAAVEDVVCSVTGAVPCAVQAACTGAIASMTAALDNFTAPSGIDLVLSGSATVLDKDGDLLADGLGGGMWSAAVLSSGNFTGTAQ